METLTPSQRLDAIRRQKVKTIRRHGILYYHAADTSALISQIDDLFLKILEEKQRLEKERDTWKLAAIKAYKVFTGVKGQTPSGFVDLFYYAIKIAKGG